LSVPFVKSWAAIIFNRLKHSLDKEIHSKSVTNLLKIVTDDDWQPNPMAANRIMRPSFTAETNAKACELNSLPIRCFLGGAMNDKKNALA